MPADKVRRDYVLPDHAGAENYAIDFCIDGPREPLFLFGIPTTEKAKLTTIILEHWLREKVAFNSLLVFENQQTMPRKDLARLTNVGGEMVSSLDARDDLERKIRARVGA